MVIIKIKADYYQQYDADYTFEVPAENFGGWKSTEINLDLDHVALVIMHAWDCGIKEQYPGWFRHVEYLPRAREIAQKYFPPLLKSVRSSSIRIFHVVGGGKYYQKYSGYHLAKKMALKPIKYERLKIDDFTKKLREFHNTEGGSGLHNQADITRGFQNLEFLPEAIPMEEEGIAENSPQLAGLCKYFHISHLIYIGFAINWCLLLSPGGMAEMSKYGVMCSTITQAVTAVENKETARAEWAKKIALWRVALAFGFVFDINEVLQALKT